MKSFFANLVVLEFMMSAGTIKIVAMGQPDQEVKGKGKQTESRDRSPIPTLGAAPVTPRLDRSSEQFGTVPASPPPRPLLRSQSFIPQSPKMYPELGQDSPPGDPRVVRPRPPSHRRFVCTVMVVIGAC